MPCVFQRTACLHYRTVDDTTNMDRRAADMKSAGISSGAQTLQSVLTMRKTDQANAGSRGLLTEEAAPTALPT